MREIKFRSWDNDKMIDVKILEYVPEHKSFSGKAGYNINYHLGIPAENLMQYTGLKDKNGLDDIYEGDIIGVDGLKKGNVYENGSLLEKESNLIIQGFGTSSWEATNKKAMERGCRYSE